MIYDTVIHSTGEVKLLFLDLLELLCQPLTECDGVIFAVEKLRLNKLFIVDRTLYPVHQRQVSILASRRRFFVLLHGRGDEGRLY